jgi:hypothetical protein
MKRRAFFGFAAGAAVAGPGLAKEVAAKAAAELAGVGGSGAMLGIPSAPFGNSFGGMIGNEAPSLLQRAAAATGFLRSMTSDQKNELRRRFGEVHRLDSDLASYHSMSMAARIEIQKERNVEAYLASRKTWWQGVLDRGSNDYASDPFNDI